MTVAAVVLAAGAASRFGGGKLLAMLDGRPILQHVLDGLAAAGIADVVVVVGGSAAQIEGTIAWRAERRVANPHPDDGLSSSLRLGLGQVDEGVRSALIVLGDQPRLQPSTIRRLVEAAAAAPGADFVVPRYTDGSNPNPVLVRRTAFRLADGLLGDDGFGSIIRTHPGVVEVSIDSVNPDVDTRADLARLAGNGGTPADVS
jgi:molybdenum cofactor cytidylyltransferase